MKNSPNAGRSVPIPTNRELTVSLIGSLIRFAIDVPQVLRRRENLSPDKLFFLLLPIVRNLGKLIDRIRHSSSVVGRNASDGSAHFEKSGGAAQLPHTSSVPTSIPRASLHRSGTGTGPISTSPTTAPTNAMLWQATQQVSPPHNPHRQRQQQQPHQNHRCTMTSMLMSDEDDEESTVAFEMHRDSVLPPGPPCRQVLRQKDGNYAIRETTDTRSVDGTFQRITKTISGPDVMILTNITSQLSELPTLMPRTPAGKAVARAEK